VPLLAFGAGVFCLFAVQVAWKSTSSCGAEYSLLNPALRCENRAAGSEWSYETIRNDIIDTIEEYRSAGKIDKVSVYFRELDNGPRFGIEDSREFFPASLLKVPAMLAVLHIADDQPEILDKKLSYSGALPAMPNVESADETIGPDTPYTVHELLNKMIVHSDNGSKDLLVRELNSLPPPVLYNTFLDLGILPMMDGTTKYVSIQSYAYLFAVLYNAGYLSREMSQYALELLLHTTFNDGIVAGVPPGTRVAHKFGFRKPSDIESQLHDCGIVYHPAAAYILCVMTSGTNAKDETEGIEAISRVTYDAVTALHEGR
jgi:beta-lactamase class A